MKTKPMVMSKKVRVPIKGEVYRVTYGFDTQWAQVTRVFHREGENYIELKINLWATDKKPAWWRSSMRFECPLEGLFGFYEFYLVNKQECCCCCHD